MNRYIFTLVLSMLVMFSVAQNHNLTGKGKRVYIENSSKNENAIKTKSNLEQKLSEWAYWQVVDKPSQADFVISTDTETSKGIRAFSWGGTSYKLVAQVKDKQGEVLWESNAYKSSPNGTNGFNSGEAVVSRLVKDLKKRYGN